MARRGGRRGRRSRSRQNRSRRSTRSTRSRRTTTRRSAPSRRRNTRTTTRASNRRATVSKARRAAPKRTAPKKKAPTRRSTPASRRTSPSNTRANVSKARRTNQKVTGIGPVASGKSYAKSLSKAPNRSSFNKAVKTIQNKNLVATTPYNKLSPGLQNILQNQYGAFEKQGKGAGELKRLQKQYPGFAPRVDLAAAGNMTNLGIRNNEATAFKVKDPSSYGVKSPDTLGRDVSFGPVADGATYAKNITNYGMKFGKTPEARGKAYEQTLSGRKGLFDNATSGSGPVASGDAYARGLKTSRFGSPMNAAKTVLNTIPGVNFRLQNDKELADSVGRAPDLTRRRRGSSGGVSRIQQQAAATQMQPEIAPTIGTPEEELLPSQTAPQGDLTRIQSQAYNTQLTSSLAGMFGGQGSVGYTPQGSPELSPTLRAGRSRGRRRVRLFGGRGRRGGTGDQFSRAGDRIAKLTNINI